MLEPKLLLPVLALTTSVCGVFMLLNWLIHRTIAGTKQWMLFVTSVAIACILISQPQLSDFWRVFVANHLILLGLVFLTLGTERFFQIKSKYWPWVLLSLIHLAGYTWFTFIDPNFIVRVCLNYLVWALSLGLCIHALFQSKVSELTEATIARWTFLLACIGMLVIFTLRLLMLDGYQPSDSLQTNNFGNQLFTITVIAIPLLLCFSLSLLCSSRRAEQVEQTKQAAEKASMLKGRYLTLLSHELRTPLNAIVGHAEMLKSVPREPLKHAQLCDIITGAAMSLSDLANQVLLQAKGETKPHELAIVDIQQVSQEIIDLLSPLAKEKHLSVALDTSALSIKSYLADKESLTLILKNLLSNAIKYTVEGGVTVTVKSEQVGSNHHSVQFFVSDTGVGLNDDDLVNIFEPFVTVSTEQTVAQGAGLGLSLCKQLVENMNGELRVRSQVGCGTEFFFELLLERIDPTINIGVTERYTNHQNGLLACNILVVEDNLLNREVLKHYLTELGAHFVFAHNLAQASKKVVQQPFDIILLDMHLPDGHGLSWFVDEFSLMNLSVSPTVIALTGDADEQAQQAYLEHGITYCISKPVSQSTLSAVLEQVCAAQSTEVLDSALVDEDVLRQLSTSLEVKFLSTKLQYLPDTFDYEFAQLQGLADIKANDILNDKLIHVGQESKELGMIALSQELKLASELLQRGEKIDWQALHSFAKESIVALQAVHAKVVA
ncbi:response regulator [Pseudoalteromonas sp. MMG013]|uniref:hybrid sensor histidine kinase/response regulator n=1 Tax=Pseudoalteromonas sp. MMG013 TaxID=2822687 RepID=UPI001B39C203|nr:ATP-binding protein [Pseudoalteromonas sp. MMG013]MBQ4862610.1 response regulator [Pseudoalteromonas sp. MMG013]